MVVRDSAKESPSGFHSYVDYFKIIKTTDTILIKRGVRFGVEYILNSKNEETIPLFAEWVFPAEIKNNQNKSFKKLKYETTRNSNELTFSSYRIEEDYEAVAGKWIFRLYYDKKVVYEKIFILI